MATPAQINTLRATDYPNGLDKDGLDRLFQILNPFLQQLQATTTKGTSLGQNVDGLQQQFTFVAAATFTPLNIRLPDGKQPRIVLCWARSHATKSVVSSWNPAWTYLGQGKTGNLMTIDDLVGLTPDTQYTVGVFIFF